MSAGDVDRLRWWQLFGGGDARTRGPAGTRTRKSRGDERGRFGGTARVSRTQKIAHHAYQLCRANGRRALLAAERSNANERGAAIAGLIKWDEP